MNVICFRFLFKRVALSTTIGLTESSSIINLKTISKNFFIRLEFIIRRSIRRIKFFDRATRFRKCCSKIFNNHFQDTLREHKRFI